MSIFFPFEFVNVSLISIEKIIVIIIIIIIIIIFIEEINFTDKRFTKEFIEIKRRTKGKISTNI